jgi:ketosteroid isomerase-like protein
MYWSQMAGVNVETLRRGYDALNRGDMSIVLELFDPDIEWHEPAFSPDAASNRRRDSFERFLRGWLESFNGFRAEPEQVVERGDELVVVVPQTGIGCASGLTVQTRLAHVWTVEDGTAVRWEAVPDPEAALGDGG